MDYKEYEQISTKNHARIYEIITEGLMLVNQEFENLELTYGEPSDTMVLHRGLRTIQQGLEQVIQGIQIFAHG